MVHSNERIDMPESSVPSGNGDYLCNLCGTKIGGWGHGGSYDPNGVWHGGGGGSVNAHTCYACKKCGVPNLTSSNWFTPIYTIVFNKNY